MHEGPCPRRAVPSVHQPRKFAGFVGEPGFLLARLVALRWDSQERPVCHRSATTSGGTTPNQELLVGVGILVRRWTWLLSVGSRREFIIAGRRFDSGGWLCGFQLVTRRALSSVCHACAIAPIHGNFVPTCEMSGWISDTGAGALPLSARFDGAHRRARSVLTAYPRHGVMRGNHRLTFAR